MSRSIVLGNGESLVTLDKFGMVRDFYFPKIGLENHIGGKCSHKIGVEIGGKISFFEEDKNWNIKIKNGKEKFSSIIEAENNELGVSINFKDSIYNEHSIFIRNIEVTNKLEKSREIKLHFFHEFEISGFKKGDTAFFDHKNHAIIHYKGPRVFMINGEIEREPFSDYKIIDDKAESSIAFSGFFEKNESKEINYWIIAAHSISEAQNLNTLVFKKTLNNMVKSTDDFWKSYIDKYDFNFYELKPEISSLFKKSLLIIRSHADNGGAIISSSDSSSLNKGKDTYSFMWPRDATFSSMALVRSGDNNASKRFFEFCKDIVNTDGYFMHKYLPDKTLGSFWNSLNENGKFQLPIQEDETAIVIWGLYEYYKRTHDIEFVELLYSGLIEKSANFMVDYRDSRFNLPKPSYDLWEEKIGVSTYTSSSIYGALIVASEFSRILGRIENAKKYKDTAEEIKKGILNYLYDKNSGNFLKSINGQNSDCVEDKTIDISSVFGIFFFGVLPVNDARLERAMNQTVGALSNNIKGLGLSRYFGDDYLKVKGKAPGNIWFISTLWFTQYLIAKAQSEKDFNKVREYLDWVAEHSLDSGVLSEQINPINGKQISAAPFTWSHAEFVNTVIKYLDRLEELGICKACNPIC